MQEYILERALQGTILGTLSSIAAHPCSGWLSPGRQASQRKIEQVGKYSLASLGESGFTLAWYFLQALGITGYRMLEEGTEKGSGAGAAGRKPVRRPWEPGCCVRPGWQKSLILWYPVFGSAPGS